ncbi:SLAP domain-containing protein, partial [Lactobacillus pasteurii]
PVAASVVNTTFADTTSTTSTTTKPTVDLTGAGVVTDGVKVTPNFVLTAAVGKKSDKAGKPGTVTASATLQGTITASLNGTSVEANVVDAAKSLILTSDTGNTTIYKYDDTNKKAENHLGEWNTSSNDVYVKAGNLYNVTLKGVGFSFGSANANKEVALDLPSDVTVEGGSYDSATQKLKLDQYGNATNLTFTVKGIKAYDATNTSAVQFYNTKSGLLETKGSYMTLAANGTVNVNTLLADLKKQYKAVQLQNGSLKDFDVTTTAADLIAELKKANITVNAAGDFTAPASFTVTLTAKSTVNGKVATLPVVVTVPNAAVPAEVTTTKNIMHVAKIYDKDGKATSEASLHAYDSVTVVKDPVTINGAKYFKLAGKDQYVKFGNIEGTSRTLSHNSYVYKNTGKATTVKSGKKTVKKLLKKGSSVTTFGSAFNINGHKMYRIGKNQYVKVANF